MCYICMVSKNVLMNALCCLLALLPVALRAQTSGDRIVAIIDDIIVLESDVEAQLEYLKKSGQKDDGTLRCTVLENILNSKLLLAKAKQDSLTVSPDQVETELARRLDLMERQLGSQKAIEEVAGKSYLQFKLDMRPQIEEQLLAQNQRNKVFNEATITPKDVKDYFASIPKDSVPYLPAELELSQIVIVPKPSQANKDKARDKLVEIRKMIVVEGKDFATLAKGNSEDPGSRAQGGMLPRFCRGDMVPEFEEVAFSLTAGEVSDVFESPFGYHIIKLEKRIGNCIEARHILIGVRIDSEDEKQAKEEALKLRKRLISEDTLTFEKAALEYSQDPATKDAGGRVTARDGSHKIPMEQLESETFFVVDDLKEGEISEPLEFIHKGVQTSKAYKLVVVRKRHDPHRASLETDYQKFYNAALTAKQNEILDNWIRKAQKQVYIELRYPACAQALSNWTP